MLDPGLQLQVIDSLGVRDGAQTEVRGQAEGEDLRRGVFDHYVQRSQDRGEC